MRSCEICNKPIEKGYLLRSNYTPDRSAATAHTTEVCSVDCAHTWLSRGYMQHEADKLRVELAAKLHTIMELQLELESYKHAFGGSERLKSGSELYSLLKQANERVESQNTRLMNQIAALEDENHKLKDHPLTEQISQLEAEIAAAKDALNIRIRDCQNYEKALKHEREIRWKIETILKEMAGR